jgi:hypothetical protein
MDIYVILIIAWIFMIIYFIVDVVYYFIVKHKETKKFRGDNDDKKRF